MNEAGDQSDSSCVHFLITEANFVVISLVHVAATLYFNTRKFFVLLRSAISPSHLVSHLHHSGSAFAKHSANGHLSCSYFRHHNESTHFPGRVPRPKMPLKLEPFTCREEMANLPGYFFSIIISMPLYCNHKSYSQSHTYQPGSNSHPNQDDG